MSKAISITHDGLPIYLEIEDEPEIVLSDMDTEGTAGVQDLMNKLDQVGSTIFAVCSSVHEKAYTTLGNIRPTSFELEFGVTLAGEVGVPMVTKGSAQCMLKVKAKWGALETPGQDEDESEQEGAH
jgi:hypothetical protein